MYSRMQGITLAVLLAAVASATHSHHRAHSYPLSNQTENKVIVISYKMVESIGN